MEVGFFKPPQSELFRRIASTIFGPESDQEIDTDALEVMVNLQYVAKNISVAFGAELGSHKLSEAKMSCLMFLFIEEVQGHPAPSPSNLAESLGVTRATITGLLDGLERDGFIERRRESRDRRAIALHIGDKSRQILHQILPVHARMIGAIMAPLTATEKRQLILLLRKIDVSKGLAMNSQESGPA